MGIHLNLAVLLHDWIARHDLTGPVLTLGVQDIGFRSLALRSALPDVARHGSQATSSAIAR